MTDDDLRTLFQPFGEIVDLYMKSNDRGPFAFVTFSSLEEAEKGKEYIMFYSDATEWTYMESQSESTSQSRELMLAEIKEAQEPVSSVRRKGTWLVIVLEFKKTVWRWKRINGKKKG